MVFDEEGCDMLHTKTRKVIRIQRERGVFVIDAFVELGTASDFTRQA